jgi:glucose/arabinose dehydrogenase
MPRPTVPVRSLFVLLLCLAAACSSDAQEQFLRLRNAFPKLSFSNPVDLQHPGDGSNRLFVVEQAGAIRVFDNSASVANAPVFLDIQDRVEFEGEMGLLGLAFHPNFVQNGYFYLNYTALNPLRTIIARYQVRADSPDVADTNSGVVLLEFEQPFPNHNGGQITFGPDGYLYIAVGDGGSGGDPRNYAQRKNTVLGKILRIDVNAESGGRKYAIPPDNPFINNTTEYREEIYAWGLRNPWRISFDPVTGWLWAGDVGQGDWEEVDVIEKGKNYGWKIMEGLHCFPPGTATCDTAGLTMPIWEYNHNLGISITGGYVYRGKRLPELVGEYICGDFGSGRIWGIRYDGMNPATNRLLLASGMTIGSFGVDADNELYLCSFNGRIYTFEAVPAGVPADDRPAAATLLGTDPNPFSGSTVIRYSLARTAHVQLVVHDMQGEVVATLVDGEQEAGEHHARFEAVSLPAGTYGYMLTVEQDEAVSGTMTVVR